MRGGYQILDLAGITFATGVAQTIPGAYEKVHQQRKPVLVSGLKIGDATYQPFGMLFVEGETADAGSVVVNDTITITVTPADAVTVTVT